MLTQDFLQRFNGAVREGNWSNVKVWGESIVADQQPSPEILYNLGLAYLKTGDAPMAISVLLAVPSEAQDDQYRLVLNEALRQSGHDQVELDLGAHGVTGILATTATRIKVEGYYGLCAGSLAITGICLLMVFRTRWQSVHTGLLRGIRLVTIAVGVLSGVVTLYALTLMGVSAMYGGHWAAVVASESAPVRLAASQDAEVVKALKPGQPVLVLGDPSKPWVKVIESGGGSGWMNALDVRCIHGRL